MILTFLRSYLPDIADAAGNYLLVVLAMRGAWAWKTRWTLALLFLLVFALRIAAHLITTP